MAWSDVAGPTSSWDDLKLNKGWFLDPWFENWFYTG